MIPARYRQAGFVLFMTLTKSCGNCMVPEHHVWVLSRLQDDRGTGTIRGVAGLPGEAALARPFSGVMGPIDLVVASSGSWWADPSLLDMAASDGNAVMAGSLTSHLAAVRAFLPLVRHREDGQYLLINGGGG